MSLCTDPLHPHFQDIALEAMDLMADGILREKQGLVAHEQFRVTHLMAAISRLREARLQQSSEEHRP